MSFGPVDRSHHDGASNEEVPMSTVHLDISMSLDGFVAGPNDGPDLGLGEGGEQLHEWVFGLASWRGPHGLEGGTTDRSGEIVDEAFSRSGAIVVGRRMFDNAHGWGDDPPFHRPVFVVTHEAREPLEKGDTTFTFVNGIESAIEQARAAAGDKDVSIGGGASVAQQALRAGLLDELQIHLVPLMLGGGVRLLEDLGGVRLELDRVVDTPGVTHLRYRVVT
jgi:dihydrofolate reductase